MQGSCFCKAVTFLVGAPSLWSAHCHCTQCQRAHGAAFVTWVGCNAASVIVEDPSDSLAWYASTAPARRGFCRACGSTLFFKSSVWPGELHIARALFHGDVDREPDRHSFYETHVPWLNLGDDLPKGRSDGRTT